MRNNKISIFWASIIAAVSLKISVILQCKCFEYTSNLFAGIFASSILVLLVSIVNYQNERRRTLEKFCSYAWKAATNYNSFENEGNLERTIDSILAMDKFDYLELDNAYGDISFIFNNKKNREYIYRSIYEPIITLRRLIHEKCFHFNMYRGAVHGNMAAMQNFITEIDTAIMQRTEEEIENDDGTFTKICSCHNQIARLLHKELAGKFYRIMYYPARRK